MTIRLWKGYHEPGLADLVRSSWEADDLLILCPPGLKDYSFIPALMEAEFPVKPVLGVFTSGTLSSRPRLVLYSKRGALTALAGIFGLFDRRRIRHVFCYPQAFHTFGLTLGYLAAHVFHWQLHTPQGKYRRESHRARMDLRESSVLTLGTPTHFFDLISESRRLGTLLTPSYSCIVGGAPVSRSLWLDIRDRLRVEAPSIGYGCTEAGPGISHLRPGVEPKRDAEIGLPLTSIDSRVVPGSGVEIACGSLCLAIVENGRVEFPSAVMIRDKVEIAPNRSWSYGGRLDLTLNRGGAKISLEDIEMTLQSRLGLTTIACAIPDTRLGEDLGLAFLRGGNERPADVLARADAVLRDSFGLGLNRARFLEEFPLNESSKPDRKSVWTMLKDEGNIAP